MEKVAPQKRQHCRTTVPNIISSLCSVASIAFCILLSINAADIKNRVVDLESGNGERTFIRAPGYSMDDFNSLIQQRVDELLSQRSYENFVKIRTARQASPECNCPPVEDGNHCCWSPLMLLLHCPQRLDSSAPLSELGGKSSTKDSSQTLPHLLGAL
ncbi:collagen alpha-1(XXV) chain isoform X1 [Lates japonicus]|uniref:Collagen alpha-1(XXV) chain isoform X1 n=1 Tax=Lates japonicus TaxID=270547 RepID=A0AAD3R3J5_LATJO|nr:collagen alpha-1(XXV) chain isoform X1 [Lates japonicus]